MPTEDVEISDLELAIANFRAKGSSATSGEALLLPNWSDTAWRELFRFTKIRRINTGEALIRSGEQDRTLYFVLRGDLEIIVQSGDGMAMGSVARVGPGSILGELAFFDGGPRSAGAWALSECRVAAMPPDQFDAFESSNPDLAREFVFALARILAMRLRRTTARIAR